MTRIGSIIDHLEALLTPAAFSDNSVNGLQVESQKKNIEKVAFAVDSGLSIIKKAVEQEADLLIVHHGLLWGDCQPITGIFGEKINLLLSGQCSLYAAHLPLDAHPEVGNNFSLGRLLELENLQEFFEHEGNGIGARGSYKTPKNLEFFIKKASELEGAAAPLVLPFGNSEIVSVGIVSGSAWRALEACHREELDLFVSGEAAHGAYHLAKELQINAVFMGHYATETPGVRNLQQRLEKYFDISTVFIQEPTGI